MNLYIAQCLGFRCAVWAYSASQAEVLATQVYADTLPTTGEVIIEEEHAATGKFLQFLPTEPGVVNDRRVDRLLGAQGPNELQCELCGFYPFGLPEYDVCPECRCCHECVCHCEDPWR